jgi:hypothetical protein
LLAHLGADYCACSIDKAACLIQLCISLGHRADNVRLDCASTVPIQGYFTTVIVVYEQQTHHLRTTAPASPFPTAQLSEVERVDCFCSVSSNGPRPRSIAIDAPPRCRYADTRTIRERAGFLFHHAHSRSTLPAGWIDCSNRGLAFVASWRQVVSLVLLHRLTLFSDFD